MEQALPPQVIPLEQIRPDPAQPRRLLPLDLADALAAGASPFGILAQLRARAERDRWTRERLSELDALSNSIGSDGLLQPIRVIRDDDRYRIEEGERRWWAHHILVQQGKHEFQSIAAFVVEQENDVSGLLRRRVAENVLRSGFTAIELARAMASRIQEILAVEPNTKRSEAERRVGGENGMSDRRVRQFVALLTLSPEAQEVAQQARLTENSLRRIVGIKDTASQLTAIRELMHPAQEGAKPRQRGPARKRSRSSRTPQRGGGNEKRGTQAKDESSKRRKQSVRKPPRKQCSRRDAEQGKLRKMRQLLMLAKSLQGKDLQRLDRTDWTRMIEKEKDRRVLANLYDVLGRGLGIIEGQSEAESVCKDG
jgi:ParB/RepB/Spo0J family partition protein